MSPLRVGIIGAGLAVERLHLPALANLKQLFTVTACASRNFEKAKAFARRFEIPSVELDGDSLLRRKDIDAVLLSLPIELNAIWASKALLAGKPAMGEKPIASTRDEAAALCRLANQKNSPPLLIAENYVFTPHMARAIELVKSGAIGQPRIGVVHQLQNAIKANSWLTEWRTKPVFDGGFVLDGGVHIGALLNAMFGRPNEVIARPGSFEKDLPPIDTGAALICYESGLKVLWATGYSASPGTEAMLAIHGSEGSVEVFWERTDWRDSNGEVQSITSPENGYQCEWRHFYDVLAKKCDLAYRPERALEDMDLLLRICGK